MAKDSNIDSIIGNSASIWGTFNSADVSNLSSLADVEKAADDILKDHRSNIASGAIAGVQAVSSHLEALGHTATGEDNFQEHAQNIEDDVTKGISAAVKHHQKSRVVSETYIKTSEFQRDLHNRVDVVRNNLAKDTAHLEDANKELAKINKQLFDEQEKLNRMNNGKRAYKVQMEAKKAAERESRIQAELKAAEANLSELEVNSEAFTEVSKTIKDLKAEKEALQIKKRQFDVRVRRREQLKKNVNELKQAKSKIKTAISEAEKKKAATEAELAKAESELQRADEALKKLEKADPSVKKHAREYQKKQIAKRETKKAYAPKKSTDGGVKKLHADERVKTKGGILTKKKDAETAKALKKQAQKKAAIKKTIADKKKVNLWKLVMQGKNTAEGVGAAAATSSAWGPILAGIGLVIVGLFIFLLILIVIISLLQVKMYPVEHMGEYNVKMMVLEAETAWRNAFITEIGDICALSDNDEFDDPADFTVPPVDPHMHDCFAYWYAVRTADAWYEYENFNPDNNVASPYQYVSENLEAVNGYDGTDTGALQVGGPLDFHYTRNGGTYHICHPGRGIAYDETVDWESLNSASDWWETNNYLLQPSDYFAFFQMVEDMNFTILVPEVSETITGYAADGTPISVRRPYFSVVTEYSNPFEYLERNRGNYSDAEYEKIKEILTLILNPTSIGASNDNLEKVNFERLWRAIHRMPTGDDVQINLMPGRVAVNMWAAMGGQCSSGNLDVLEEYINANYTAPDGDFWDLARAGEDLYESDMMNELNVNLEIVNPELAEQFRAYRTQHIGGTEAHPINSRIDYFLEHCIGSPGTYAWCNAFVSFCFQNGVQGYFDIPYAWELTWGVDGSDLHAINDPGGIYGSYARRIQALQAFQAAMGAYTGYYGDYVPGSGPVDVPEYASFDEWTDIAGDTKFEQIHDFCEEQGISSLSGSGDIVPGVHLGYSDLLTFSSSSMFWTTVENELFDQTSTYFSDWDTPDSINSAISTAEIWLDGALKAAMSQASSAGDDRWLYSDEADRWITALGNYIYSFSMLEDAAADFDLNVESVYRADDVQTAIWLRLMRYYNDSGKTDDEVRAITQNWYIEYVGTDPATEAVPEGGGDFTEALGAVMGLYDPDSGYYPWNSIAPWSESIDGGMPRPVYLYTDNYHVDLNASVSIDAAHSYLAGSAWQTTSNYVGLNMTQELEGSECLTGGHASPADDDTNITIYASPRLFVGYNYEQAWEPYNGGQIWGDYISSLVRPGQSFGSAVMHFTHTRGSYIPYFSAYLGRALQGDSPIYANVAGTNGSFYELALTYGANPYGADYPPIFNLLAEIPQEHMDCWNGSSTTVAYTIDWARNTNRWIDWPEIDDGATICPGDAIAYCNDNDIDEAHIGLIVDVYTPEDSDTEYYIVADGNSSNTVHLACLTRAQLTSRWLRDDGGVNRSGYSHGIIRTFIDQATDTEDTSSED